MQPLQDVLAVSGGLTSTLDGKMRDVVIGVTATGPTPQDATKGMQYMRTMSPGGYQVIAIHTTGDSRTSSLTLADYGPRFDIHADSTTDTQRYVLLEILILVSVS